MGVRLVKQKRRSRRGVPITKRKLERVPGLKPWQAAQRARLNALRELLGLGTFTELIRKFNLPEKRWLGYFSGRHPISRNSAIELAQQIDGMSRTWLEDGSPEGLNLRWHQELVVKRGLGRHINDRDRGGGNTSDGGADFDGGLPKDGDGVRRFPR